MPGWGYEHSECPPQKWHTLFPIAEGKRQSPIDVRPGEARKEKLPRLKMDYANDEVKHVENNGHSVTFHLEGKESKISGGPISGSYKLLQFHFHWGSENSKGSEHTLDGHAYAAELHFVHQNEKYATFAEAIGKPDGLAVIGVFIKVGGDGNKAFEFIEENIQQVTKQGEKKSVKDKVKLKRLLPKKKVYVTYPGSLTTPTLNECVTWINLLEPVSVSEKQIAAFRSLTHGSGDSVHPLVNNFRLPQPLHERYLTIAGEEGDSSDSD